MSIAALAVACGSALPEITPSTADADRILLERGQAALEAEDWLDAVQYFSQLRDNYPQSPYRADARLGVAQAYVGQGTVEAVVTAEAEFTDFLALYPTHPRAADAQYGLAMLHFEQMRGPGRDQAATHDAIAAFELFIERYPDSPLVGDVRDALRIARNRLSEHEFIIGEYYHRRKAYQGAIDRLESILATDPGYAGRADVYFYLGDSYARLDQPGDALPYIERLISEFPESEHREEAEQMVLELRAALAQAEEAAADLPPDGASQPEKGGSGTPPSP